jgi:Uma2 family endonuclease
MDNPLVVFEVLSPSTRRKDLNFKRTYYSGLPSLLHYVAVEPKELFVRQFSRTNDWNERKMRKANTVLSLPEIGAKLLLADIYRRTGLVPAEPTTKKST